MKCSLDLLKQSKVRYSWSTLFVGIKLGLLQQNSVISYAEELINDSPEINNNDIIELLWAKSEEQIDQILERLVFKKDEIFDETIEKRKLSFSILNQLIVDIQDEEELLEKVAEVYSIMGYPDEMSSFIYYLPPDDGHDPLAYSKEKNLNRLIVNLNKYVTKEREFLQIFRNQDH
ncbi:DUF2247 family protein [Brevibacillus fortis]|uniref:DUF2247 family protein n=1 Tax=Brevibacillus fortis TaxID=2126352 RepID=UPI002E1D1DD4|nr:DUF2247 family protein [Brevibacillus fortis]